ncbi:ecotin family protein [Photobacterium sanguinicancri]|uniref:Ecotin n=1 Tax=Photobacterium sanguinicancri TaxID=875932 RepID=A0AAW7Y3R7_9GAMM|nr:ecotin family protein [Photobacterium sanguinicancri]MDO6543024.1 ecotin family protein [Photobacterium sanguinicancri]OZS45179.1 ecotin [Photobacterium sanguinicancri]
MKRTLTTAVLAALLLSGCAAPQNNSDDMKTAHIAKVQSEMKAYPKASAGMTRHVFILEPLANEEERLVEIVISKTLKLDCNNYMLPSALERKVAQGWGYPYYRYDANIENMVGTLMACPKGKANVEKTVRAPRSELYRYNSKLPVVVYAPENLDVSYRVWQPEVKVATQK